MKHEVNETPDRCPHNARPRFLITIDTEGDNLWSSPQAISTRNAKFLPRFQSLCEGYGLKPTYLTNFEMATCPDFQEFGRDILKRGTGEIGMHLHAWNSPPLIPLTPDDGKHHPYLIEYPPHIMREKITFMTELLEDTFGVKMVSHRAGKWSFNATYAQILLEKEYQVDCSVTPHVSWQHVLGDPGQSGGTDYSHFPETAYMVDPEDIRQSGNSPLLEVPVTIYQEPRQKRVIEKIRGCFREGSLPWQALSRFFPPVLWLRPNGRNLNTMLQILRQASEKKRDYVEFMLHSSELMPGGSARFRRHADIESLYETLEILFSTAHGTFKGATLAEYYREFCARHILDHATSTLSREHQGGTRSLE